MADITSMRWNGAAVIDRQGPGGSWRIRMVNADRVLIVEGMTDTAMLDFARQINRTVRESKRKETE